MIVATVTLVVLALAMAAYAWTRHDGSLRRGIDSGWLTLKRNLALLLLAFAIVGYVDVLSPTHLIQTWIGPHSGCSGDMECRFKCGLGKERVFGTHT